MSTTRNLRNRSSRYSSPATFPEKEVPAKQVDVSAPHEGSNGYHASFDQWVEPSVRNAVPSFEDTKGLERLGVLEHMAPLGAPPSQKLLQKLKVNFIRSSPRSTPLHLDDVDALGVESTRTELTSPIESEPLPEPIRIEEPMVTSPPRGRPAKKDAEEMRQAFDPTWDPTTPSPVKSSSQHHIISPKPQSIQDFIRQDRMKNSVRRAIEEARRESDMRLVPGLESILEDARSNSLLWNVIDAVANKTPTSSQFRIFKGYIKRGIKQHQSGDVSPQNPSKVRRESMSSLIDANGGPRTNRDQLHLTTSQMHGSPPSKTLRRSRSSAMRSSRVSPADRMSLSPPPGELECWSPGRAPMMGSLESMSTRSASASTTSSLSSAKSMPDDYHPAGEAPGHEGRSSRTTAQRQAANQVAPASRTRSSAKDLPGSAQTYSGPPTTIRFINKKFSKTKNIEENLFNKERLEAKRAELARGTVQGYNDVARYESHERSAIVGISLQSDSRGNTPRPPVLHPHPIQPVSATLLSSPSSQFARSDNLIVNGTARKRTYDEFERDERDEKDENDINTPMSSSPAPSDALPPPPPPLTAAAAVESAPAVMRGSTPRATRLPPPNKPRKSARVMVSPNKPKNGGVTAGISRAGAGRENAMGNGMESGAEDNDEFCASCGGEGTLLCCDGCTNSFHHTCLEPPMDPEKPVIGEWFCPECVARRNKQPVQITGLLGQVIRRVDDTIPKAYALPFEIRDYFEGVRTGEEGEYEETSLPRTQNNTQKMNRAGFIDQPNYKELRDAKGNFITCFGCNKTSNGRDIIPCDFCPAKWHTDCITPPMAVPPRRIAGDKPNNYWRCPLHLEHDLANLSRQAELAPHETVRIPRLRRPKKAIQIDVDMSRGFRNNGVIEVELMKDEMPDIKEISLDGGIYRLPESGIRLDFIDRVKKSWYEDHALARQANAQPSYRHRLYRPSRSVLHHPAASTVSERNLYDTTHDIAATAVSETTKANKRLRQKSFREQSAILSLVRMTEDGDRRDSADTDALTDLVNQLIAEAPSAVEHEINLSEREQLLRLKELLERRLAIVGEEDSTSADAYQIALPDKSSPHIPVNGMLTPADQAEDGTRLEETERQVSESENKPEPSKEVNGLEQDEIEGDGDIS